MDLISIVWGIVFLQGFQIISGEEIATESTGYCAVYNGRICKSHINARQVWFSINDGSGGFVNEQTTSLLFDEMISELPPICRSAAEVNTPYNNKSNRLSYI